MEKSLVRRILRLHSKVEKMYPLCALHSDIHKLMTTYILPLMKKSTEILKILRNLPPERSWLYTDFDALFNDTEEDELSFANVWKIHTQAYDSAEELRKTLIQKCRETRKVFKRIVGKLWIEQYQDMEDEFVVLDADIELLREIASFMGCGDDRLQIFKEDEVQELMRRAIEAATTRKNEKESFCESNRKAKLLKEKQAERERVALDNERTKKQLKKRKEAAIEHGLSLGRKKPCHDRTSVGMLKKEQM
jgi:hypothetical protein